MENNQDHIDKELIRQYPCEQDKGNRLLQRYQWNSPFRRCDDRGIPRKDPAPPARLQDPDPAGNIGNSEVRRQVFPDIRTEGGATGGESRKQRAFFQHHRREASSGNREKDPEILGELIQAFRKGGRLFRYRRSLLQ